MNFEKKNLNIKKCYSSCNFLFLFLITLLQVSFDYCVSCNNFYIINDYQKFYTNIETSFNYLENKFKRILVLFDIDDTITYCQNNIAGGRFNFYDAIQLLKMGGNPIKKASLIWQNNKRTLIQDPIQKIIEFYKNKKNTSVVGLTKSFSKNFGIIKDFPKARIDELKGWNIVFSEENITKNNNFYFSLKNFSLKKIFYNNPCFREGIIFTNQLNKGDVFDSFCDYMEELPDCIIIFDDNEKNIKNIEKVAASKNIPIFSYQCIIKKNE
jgi:hypothetical protein